MAKALNASGLHERLAVLRRRKWVFVVSAAVIPAAAVLYSLHQPARYQASADVLLGRQNTIASLSGTPDVQSVQDPQRNVDTQAAIAREPEVARRVLVSLHLRGRSPQDFLRSSSVSSRTDTNLLTLSVTDRSRSGATALATSYAKEFADFSRELDTNAIRKALHGLNQQLSQIPASGRRSQYYSSLVDRSVQLQTALALLTSNASVVRVADLASQVQPTPLRNGLLGLVLGLVLGIALAFLREGLDTRVRTADEVRAVLGLPLLARVARPARRLRNNDDLIMVASPTDQHAEPFRVLRTNLEFVNLERDARTIMITSAVEQEGKSTTAANLAVALARAGKKVVLVDLDLRRPYVHRFFRCDSRPGLTEVALGHVSLDDALVTVDLVTGAPISLNGRPGKLRDQDEWDADPADASVTAEIAVGSPNGRHKYLNTLMILPSGPLPPDPGEFVASKSVKMILEALKSEADVVLVDAPPVLHVGDALSLSALVDGIIVVTQIDLIRRRTLNELHRVLESSPADKLGFVVAGARVDEDYSYSYAGYYARADERTSVPL